MRSISKAVAKLSGFLQQQCQVPKEQLDVGSWAQAKCFLGERLVTSLAGSSQGSTVPNPSLLCWLIQDTRNDICVWVDISSFASALNQTTEDLIKLWDCHFKPRVVARPTSHDPSQPQKFHRGELRNLKIALHLCMLLGPMLSLHLPLCFSMPVGTSKANVSPNV